MITAVLDTNVLASGFVSPVASPGQLLALLRGRAFALVVSDHILTELTRTFTSPYFAQRLTPAEQENNVSLIQQEARITPLLVHVSGVATHPEDDLILATALSAHVDYLVTGDTKLQALGSYEGALSR